MNSLSFSTYQSSTDETAIYPHKGELIGITYTALGLAGEAGEVAGKVSKIIRDSDGIISDEIRKDLKKELGDVLWFVAQTSQQLGLDLGEIAQANLDKLRDRKARNVIQGNGDNR